MTANDRDPRGVEGERDAESPFHAGERAVQARAGAREVSERVGRRAIRRIMPDEHRRFFESLPFAFVASEGADGFPELALVAGAPGFLTSPDPTRLVVDLGAARGAPWLSTLAPGASVGLLGIELHTRRRNRLNGTVVARDPRNLVVEVDQSFGNCKRYIQARVPTWVEQAAESAAPRHDGARLGAAALDVVARADTFFIASAGPPAPGRGARRSFDVSHRGGPRGFVSAGSDGRGSVLVFPDYAGNRFFNTLGNLELEPRASLAFVDFETRAMLRVSGYAEVIAGELASLALPRTERLVRFRVDRSVLRENAVPFRWSAPAMAPELAGSSPM